MFLEKICGVIKSTLTGVGLLLFLVFISGCGRDPQPEKPVVTVNKLKLGAQDIRQELNLKGIPFETDLSQNEEPGWLSQLIEREILVQEAQRLGLERQSEFMKSIERFWKEALIKLLLTQKSKEIAASMNVYEPEVEAYYRKLTEKDANIEPLAEIHDDVARSVREEKETAQMEEWIKGLRNNSHVSVDQKALAEIR